jgi:putative PIN family toxin of toxin-antitoxin system
LRIVLDSNILIRAFISQQGSANELLICLIRGGHRLITSGEILFEVSRILRQPRMCSIHGKSEDDVYEFTSWLRMISYLAQVEVLPLAPIRDPGDMLVLQTAALGRADILCTCDRDFFAPPAAEFLRECGITVLSDRELLKHLRQ